MALIGSQVLGVVPPVERTGQPVERTGQPAGRARARHPAVWVFRAFVPVPLAVMVPECVSAIEGHPRATAHLAASSPAVLGMGALLLFVLMLSVTPLHTVTGWRWHVVLRRDLGVGAFVVAGLDLTFAALFSGHEFTGGFLNRVAGHAFLAAGTAAVALLIPLALTSTQRSKRWLGRNWKRLHRLTYGAWGLILLHLLLLFGFRGVFLDAAAVSAPLLVLRLPPVQRWWSAARRAGDHRAVRAVLTVAVAAVFLYGLVPLGHQFAHVAAGAVTQDFPRG